MKKGLIIAGAVIVVVAVVGIILTRRVETVVEDELTTLIDELIEESGLEEILTYSELEVNTAKGALTVNDLSFTDEGMNMAIDTLNIELPPKDAISIAVNPENADITDLKVTVHGMSLTDEAEGITVTQDMGSSQFIGSINTRIFDENYTPEDSDFQVERLTLENSGVSIKSDAGVISIESIALNIDTELKASDVEGELDGFVTLINIFKNISLKTSGISFDAVQDVKDTVTMSAYMFLGDGSLVEDDKNWAIEKFNMETESENNVLNLKQLELLANWIDLDMNASFTIDEELENFLPLNIELNFNDYIETLRPTMNMFVSQMVGKELPEGSFSVNVSMNEGDGFPLIEVEDIN